MTAQVPRTSVPSEIAATGVIVVLGLPTGVSQVLAVPGGLPVADLHLTLAYLGSTEDLGSARLDTVRNVVARLAARTPALAGRVTGPGRFVREEGPDVAYVSVDAPALSAFREALLCALAEEAGVEADGRHGFTPHVTLAFVDAEEDHPAERLEPHDFVFDSLEVWAGARRDVFGLDLAEEGNLATNCEVTQGADDVAGSASARALRAVVDDWRPGFVRALETAPAPSRVRVVGAGFDDLHTRLLAAHLASPARDRSADSPEDALLQRARRVREVETDLGLLLATAADDVRAGLDGEEPSFEALVNAALESLRRWAESAT